MNNTLKKNKSHNIPFHDLSSDGQRVDFAFRTMEEIELRNGGQADVPHRHNYYTILWAKKVCGKHFIDYREYNITPNLVFFVSPGQVHQVITYQNPEGYVIMFTPEFLQHNHIRTDFVSNIGLFSEYVATPPLLIDQQVSLELSTYVEKIQEATQSNCPFKYDTISANLKLFLIACNRLVNSTNTNNPQLIETGKTLVKAFKELVENNFNTWHKVSQYSDTLNISSDYLNSVIKTTIGRTAKEYIQNRLVLEAKRLGLHTEMNSKAIAYNLGFEDPSHFSKFYKKIEGINFSDFRKELENKLL